MGTKEKLIARFSSFPNDFTWEEMRRLLVALGYVPGNKGQDIRLPHDIQRRGVEAYNASQTASR